MMDAETQRRFDALDAEVRRLRGRQEGKARAGTRGRRGAALVLALFMALVPLGMLAANPVFSDIGDAAAVHQPNIQAIGNAGITTGFDDPNNPGQRTYNPKGLVTREEMASFLARTAGLGGNPPVANALTAVTAGSATTANSATTAQTATNASQLGGQSASAYALKSDIPTTRQVRAATGGYDVNNSPPNQFDGTYRQVATTTIVAPTAGYIFITGTVTVFSTSQASVDASVAIDGQESSGINQFSSLTVAGSATSPSSIPASGLVQVTAGTHTASIVVRKNSGGSIGPFPGSRVVAIFIPFDGNGNAP